MNSSLVQNFYQQNKQLQGSVAQTALLLIVTVLFSWFIVKPQMAKVAGQQTALDKQQAEFQRVDNDKREMTKLIGELKQASSSVKLVDEALPLTTRVSSTLVLLEGLVSASGLEMAGVTVDGTELSEIISAGDKTLLDNLYGPNRKLQTQALSLQLIGGIEQFRNFLQLVETNGRVVDIDSIDIINSGNSISYRVKLKMYSYIPS